MNPDLQSSGLDRAALQRDIDELRASFHDLIVFNHLRATWHAHELPRVVSSFAELMRSLLRADLVFVRCRVPHHPDLEALLTASGVPLPADARALREKLEPFLGQAAVEGKIFATGLFGSEPGEAGIVALGPGAESGVVVAAWRQPDQTSDLRRDLLVLGAGHLLSALREREESERKLQESEQRFELAFDHAPIGMGIAEPGGRFLQVNRPFCELLGYSEAELLKKTIREITHPGDIEDDHELMSRLLAGRIERYSKEKRYLHKLGHEVWVLLHVSLVRDDRGEPRYFVGQVKDITQSKHAGEERESLMAEVSSSREQLEVLSRKLVRLQEEERHLIARELHDEVGQILTGLRLMLETSERSGSPPNLAHLHEVTGQLLRRVKDLSLVLRPPMLDDLGLIPTLLWHFEQYRAQTRVEVRFHHLGLNLRLPAEIEITAFRIIQEALTNVARHSNAREVSVELWSEQGALNLRIEDDGQGFEADSVSRSSSGLTGMRERAKLLGGELRVDSRLGGGTRLSVEIPRSGTFEPSR